MPPQNAHKVQDVRLGGSVLFFRQASKRSASRWRGAAEAVDSERDTVALLHRGGIRKVSRNEVEVYALSDNQTEEAPSDALPDAMKRQLPDRRRMR